MTKKFSVALVNGSISSSIALGKGYSKDKNIIPIFIKTPHNNHLVYHTREIVNKFGKELKIVECDKNNYFRDKQLNRCCVNIFKEILYELSEEYSDYKIDVYTGFTNIKSVYKQNISDYDNLKVHYPALYNKKGKMMIAYARYKLPHDDYITTCGSCCYACPKKNVKKMYDSYKNDYYKNMTKLNLDALPESKKSDYEYIEKLHNMKITPEYIINNANLLRHTIVKNRMKYDQNRISNELKDALYNKMDDFYVARMFYEIYNCGYDNKSSIIPVTLYVSTNGNSSIVDTIYIDTLGSNNFIQMYQYILTKLINMIDEEYYKLLSVTHSLNTGVLTVTLYTKQLKKPKYVGYRKFLKVKK